MAIQKIPIDDFLLLSKEHPVFDVRSPAEFLHAHIPGAYSLPIFTDEQRKIIGTAYKQQSRQQAIKIGLEYFGVKMKTLVEEVESAVAGYPLQGNSQMPRNQYQPATPKTVLVHCWRGGMRSGAVAWLLDLYGYKVYSLCGGYKEFRNWALQQFDKTHHFNVLGGYTGSGKTVLINQLKQLGCPVINLERLANHKGSAFGDLGEYEQPSQEMFENLLAQELFYTGSFTETRLQRTWIEDESQRIGLLAIPKSIWLKMRNSPLYFLDIPFGERLDYISKVYGAFESEKLAAAIIRIQKRLGGLETKHAISFLAKGNVVECFSILLKYYDRCYIKGLYNRKNPGSLLNKIPCRTVTVSNIHFLPLLQNTFK